MFFVCLPQPFSRPAEIHYGDSSMRNGFGLRLLHRFLGLPFLRLQKETLLSQLQRNQRETQTCSTDLTAFLQSDDANYEKFLEQLSCRRRQIADANPKNVAPSVLLAHSSSSTSIASNSSSFDQQRPASATPSTGGKSIIIGGGKPIVVPGQLNITNDPRLRQSTNVAPPSMSGTIPSSSAAPVPPKASVHTTVGFMSSLLGTGGTTESAIGDAAVTAPSNVLSVDEFCPDGGGGLDRGFLDDEAISLALNNHINAPTANDDSDTDSDTVNPMVARFHDEPATNATDIVGSPPIGQHKLESLPKVNPLAKGKATTRTTEASLLYGAPKIRIPLTSEEDDIDDDLEVPTVMARNIRLDDINDDDDDDDNDGTMLSHQRRSPEGLEDPVPRQSVALPEPAAAPLSLSDEKVGNHVHLRDFERCHNTNTPHPSTQPPPNHKLSSFSFESQSSERKHRSKSKKKDRNETKAERDVRRAEKRAKRDAKEARTGSDPDDHASAQQLDTTYEAL